MHKNIDDTLAVPAGGETAGECNCVCTCGAAEVAGEESPMPDARSKLTTGAYPRDYAQINGLGERQGNQDEQN